MDYCVIMSHQIMLTLSDHIFSMIDLALTWSLRSSSAAAMDTLGLPNLLLIILFFFFSLFPELT